MKKLTLRDFANLRNLVCRGARPLEYTMWKCVFENGGREEFLSVLSSYQNSDGGFGHNLEANNWNPNSSPSITQYAIHQLARAHITLDKNHPIIEGIVKYLSSGEHMTDDGWIVGIPTNNDYSHPPWFHYDEETSAADAGLTRDLANFIIEYADIGSEIYQIAIALIEKHKIENEPPVPDFSDYDPKEFEPWKMSPARFAPSPDRAHYPALKDAIDIELDAIVYRLQNTYELPVMHEEELRQWERNVPRKDGAAWNDNEQIIGSYYWAASDFISQIETLKTFSRLDFDLPVNCERE